MAVPSVNLLGCYEDDGTLGGPPDATGTSIEQCMAPAIAAGKAFILAKQAGANRVDCYLRPSSGNPVRDTKSLTPSGTCGANGAGIQAYIVLDTSVNATAQWTPFPNQDRFLFDASADTVSQQYAFYNAALTYYTNRYAQVVALLQMPGGTAQQKQELSMLASALNRELQQLILDIRTDFQGNVSPQCMKLSTSLQGEITQLQKEYAVFQSKASVADDLKSALKSRTANLDHYDTLLNLSIGVFAVGAILSLVLLGTS
jgi:hypothetical protein